MKNFELEICANSVDSCIAAQEGGATRVELCQGIPEGGTTPSAGMIKEACERIDIPVHVIIRPRAGDFFYSDTELRQMVYDIRVARELKADGVVFGCLTPEGFYDKRANGILLEAAEGMAVTFHRAFDMCADPERMLEEIITAGGFNRILTSGCAPTAPEGATLIGQLVYRAAGRIGIMAGSGVRASNIAELARQTGTNQFHCSLRTDVPSAMQYRRSNVSMGGTVIIDEYAQPTTHPELVRETVNLLRSI